MVSYIKGGIQDKGSLKHEPEIQEGWEWGMAKVPQWGTS